MGATPSGNHFDELDVGDVVQIRPMSSKIRHRHSNIIDTCIMLGDNHADFEEDMGGE